MLRKVILTIFRLYIGVVSFIIASTIYNVIQLIGELSKSNTLGFKTIGVSLLFVAIYILGLVIEKIVDKLSGCKASKEIKEM